tara:strand:+ start:154 stop:861 length:708 start_codon:yes stop_codon:yes gene_type:complete
MSLLGVASLFAFTVAGVAGFGGGVLLMPALVLVFGPKEAIPIVSVAALLAAISRTGLNWREIAWPVVKWHSIGAVPIAILASFLFVITPPTFIARALGILLLVFVVFRHTHRSRERNLGLRKFALVGAGTSFVGGFLGVPGPLRAPFFLAYGLTGMAYVGTSSAAMLFAQTPKLFVYRGNDLLGTEVLAVGLALGVMGFLASYIGRWIAKRASARLFEYLVEGLLIGGGVLLLFA